MTNATQINLAPEILDATVEVALRNNQNLSLYFDLDAVIAFAGVTGLNILNGDLKPECFSDPKLIIRLAKAGLQRLHPNVTEEMISREIDMHNIRYWIFQLMRALQTVLPKGPEGVAIEHSPLPPPNTSGDSEPLAVSALDLTPESTDD